MGRRRAPGTPSSPAGALTERVPGATVPTERAPSEPTASNLRRIALAPATPDGMNIPSRRLALLLLGLSGACAVEPDAPASSGAEPTAVSPAPDGVRCRPSHPVPAAPATSEAFSMSTTQDLPWVPQLYGARPDLVSGSASRVDGELWISFIYRRTEAEVTTLRGRLVGADEETLELLPSELASIPRSPEYGPGVVQLLLPPTAARALARSVEVVLEDARGLRSVALRLPLTEVVRQPDGGACGRYGLFNICREESLCSPAGRCTPVTAPTLTSAEAFVSSGPSRSALNLLWDDPNQDVVAIEVTARGRREPLVIPVADPTRVGPWSQRWDRDVFEGASWLSVRVRDQSGRFSNILNVAVSAPAPVAARDECDPDGVVSRCGSGLACTRDNGRSCIETRCAPDVVECPRAVSTTPLDTSSSADGPWVTAGSMAGAGETRASACDRSVGRALIHRFRAPSAGAYEFALSADEDTWTTRLIARTRCAISDVEAQEASTGRGQRRVALPMTLSAGQEVFLFVTTEDRFTLSATRVR